MKQRNKKITYYLRMLAGPAVPFFILPVFMVVLILGTVAQHYLGSYEAQKIFFTSFVFWSGPLPLPGGLTLSLIILIGLMTKFLFFSPWSVIGLGINLSHLGVLVILLGGVVSGLFSQEGFVTIAEGKESHLISDYYKREFVIYVDGKKVVEKKSQEIHSGQKIAIREVPFEIEILSTCQYCKIEKNSSSIISSNKKGMARVATLVEGVSSVKNEENMQGLNFAIKHLNDRYDGEWLLFDLMPKALRFSTGTQTIKVFYRRQKRLLPFYLKLNSFYKKNYPGTSLARQYNSDITVREGEIKWPVKIEMNKPFRYRGYTIYQSSFMQDKQGRYITVLAVVENIGWLFPYIGSALICFGLLWHTALKLRRKTIV